MILEQFYLGCLSQASYLIGCERTGRALVVDPRRDVDIYVEAAAKHGLTIERVLLTHYHADFISGHLELADRTGARIGLGNAVAPEYTADLFVDDERIELGDVTIEVRHTPGHTPESVCYVVYDGDPGSAAPYAVLTGDTLFIGDVGRPDLMASVGCSAEDLGTRLYHSLHEKLMTLPDETLLYPGHGAGSMCGKALSNDTVSTIGAQRRSNPSLQPMSEAEFTALVTSGQADPPQYFGFDAVQNRSHRKTLDEALRDALREISLEETRRLGFEGTVLLDVREADAFSAGHMRGSINVGLSGKFATFAGYVVAPESRIVLIGDAEQVAEAAVRLGRIGLDGVVGQLAGGFATAAAQPELLMTFLRVGPAELEERLQTDAPPALIDIRGPGEIEAGAIPGAQAIPLQHLESRRGEIPTDRPIVLICRSGYRSSLAASLLQRAGFQHVSDLAGGMLAWDAAHAERL